MGRPDDLPGVEGFRHGTRARYVAGCRCRPCTHANVARYHKREALAKAKARALGPRTRSHCVGVGGEPCPYGSKLRKDSTGNICCRCRRKLVFDGLVDASRARHHLRMLSKHGVGRLTVQDKSGVAKTTLWKVKNGSQTQVRASTEAAILAVEFDDVADGAYVDAGETWRMVGRLIRVHGYTRARISKLIGQGGRALQLGKKRVTAANARAVKAVLDDAEGKFLRGPM